MSTRRHLSAAQQAPAAAVGYVRVSMAREEMISPELQKGHLRDHEQRQSLRILDMVEDLDVSGRSFARAGIQRIIAGVEAGEWQVVLVYRYDRFGRNVRDSLVNIAKVEQAGGRVVSVTEPFDADTAIGKYGRTNILAVAELQSDLIGEGWKSTHAHRAARGLPHSGRPRFGYLYIDGTYRPDSESNRLELGLDPAGATAPYLLDAYRRFARGDSVRSICRWLNDEQIPTTAGGPWVPISLYRMLDSGFGAGLLFHRSRGEHTIGAHEPVIDSKLWERFGKMRREGRKMSPWDRRPAHPLSGLIRCGGCGKPMAAGRTRDNPAAAPRRVYRCSSKLTGLGCPDGGAIAAHLAEDAVRAWVDELAADLEESGRAAAERVEAVTARRQDRAHWSRQVARYDRQLKQLLLDRADGLILDTGSFVAARDEITGLRDKALTQLEEAEAEVTVLGRSHRPVIQALADGWDYLDVQAKRDLLRQVLRRVEINARASGRPRVVPVPVWERT
jgi:site-specific DNA recombinase